MSLRVMILSRTSCERRSLSQIPPARKQQKKHMDTSRHFFLPKLQPSPVAEAPSLLPDSPDSRHLANGISKQRRFAGLGLHLVMCKSFLRLVNHFSTGVHIEHFPHWILYRLAAACTAFFVSAFIDYTTVQIHTRQHIKHSNTREDFVCRPCGAAFHRWSSPDLDYRTHYALEVA